MDDLEGYRGIAALGVVVFHAYQFCREGAGGDSAGSSPDGYAYAGTPLGRLLLNLDGLVSLFLLLSGFLLYAPAARAVLAGRPVGSPRVFLLRRAVRILPLYWFATLLVWTYRNPDLPGDWRDLAEHLTFTQVFDSRRIFYTIGPAWSLSVEIFFYVAVALILLALRGRLPARSRSAVRVLVIATPPAVMLVGSLAYHWWALELAHQPSDRWAIWFNPLAKAEMFAMGMFLAIAHARWGDRPVRAVWLIPVRLVALAILAYGCAIRTEDARTSTEFNLLAMVAFTLLLGSSLFAYPRAWWRRTLAARPLMFVGAVSYSVYLWHEPVLLYLDVHHLVSHRAAAFPWVALLLVVVSVPLGWISYVILERPAGELKALFQSDGRLRSYYGPRHEG
ncbi:acyltransferase [Frankia sp. AiPs1]|uniref:acyltransferase family protein n=1 Tax=Frankia sp. AiPs1 TaxID=573493 RepID=UPI0020448CBC|nr:acyltransferase [Frankia sp. AiPs1]MCM3923160.1 acyltransferase [Frankia sp. AiPs1]